MHDGVIPAPPSGVELIEELHGWSIRFPVARYQERRRLIALSLGFLVLAVAFASVNGAVTLLLAVTALLVGVVGVWGAQGRGPLVQIHAEGVEGFGVQVAARDLRGLEVRRQALTGLGMVVFVTERAERVAAVFPLQPDPDGVDFEALDAWFKHWIAQMVAMQERRRGQLDEVPDALRVLNRP